LIYNVVFVPSPGLLVGASIKFPFGEIYKSLAVPAGVTTKVLLELPKVIVPDLIDAAPPLVAPIVNDVAAPPILKLVAVVLNTVAVALVVVISPPLTAMSPESVALVPEIPALKVLRPVNTLEPVVAILTTAPVRPLTLLT
jgi:hypothetical protein